MTIGGFYIDEALVFALMLVAILVAWSRFNRWEGEKQRTRILEDERRPGEDRTMDQAPPLAAE
jgi:hypothetical protein